MNTESRKHEFQKISLMVSQAVYDDHARTSTTVWGWLRNKARKQVPFFGSTSNVTKAATGAQLAAKLPALVPGLGTLASIISVVPYVVPTVQGKALYSRACKTDDVEDKAKFLAEYTALAGAQKVSDAVRKLNDARDATTKATSIRTCKNLVELLYTFNYYCYRIQRLRQYTNELSAYVAALQARIDEAEKSWESLDAATADVLWTTASTQTWTTVTLPN